MQTQKTDETATTNSAETTRKSLKPSQETVDYVMNIQNAVLASSLSCKELEEKSGIPSGTLNRILNGAGNMKFDHVVRLSQAISMELAEIANYQSNTCAADTRFLNQLSRWGKRIPESKRSLVIELLRALSECD